MTRPLSQSDRNKARRRYYANNRDHFREYNKDYRHGKKMWWVRACIRAGVSPCEFEKPKPIFI